MGKGKGNKGSSGVQRSGPHQGEVENHGLISKLSRSSLTLVVGVLIAFLTGTVTLGKSVAEILDWRVVFKTKPELEFSVLKGDPSGIDLFVMNTGGRPANIVEVSLSAYGREVERGSRDFTTWMLSLEGQSTIIPPGETRLFRANPILGPAVLPSLPPPASEEISKKILQRANCSLEIIYGDVQVGNVKSSKPLYCYSG